MQDFSLKRGDSPGMRYIRFCQWLCDFSFKKGIEPSFVIYYEQPHMRGGFATEVLHGFVTHLQAFCAKESVSHTAVHTGTLKKFATGNGHSNKHIMKLTAKDMVDREIEDDNEADAICLLSYAEDELGYVEKLDTFPQEHPK